MESIIRKTSFEKMAREAQPNSGMEVRFRKGVVGDHQNYFDDEILRDIRRIEAENAGYLRKPGSKDRFCHTMLSESRTEIRVTDMTQAQNRRTRLKTNAKVIKANLKDIQSLRAAGCNLIRGVTLISNLSPSEAAADYQPYKTIFLARRLSSRQQMLIVMAAISSDILSMTTQVAIRSWSIMRHGILSVLILLHCSWLL